MNKALLILIPLIFLFHSCQIESEQINVGEKSKEYTIQIMDSAMYEVELRKDIFYSITVMQKGIDVDVFLQNDKNEVIEEMDSPNGADGPEHFYFYCDTTAKYQLVIKPLDEAHNNKEGQYTIEIVETPKEAEPKLSQSELIKDFEIFRGIFEKANPSLYKYRSKQQVDSVFAKNKQLITSHLTYRKFYNLIWNVIDYTGSCHNHLNFPQKLEILLNRKSIFFPIPLKIIEGKLRSNFDFENIPVGVEIVSINGISATEFSASIGKFNSTDGFNKTGKYAFIETSLLPLYIYYAFGKQTHFEIEYIHQNNQKQKVIDAITYNEFSENYKNRHSRKFEEFKKEDYTFNYLDSINTGLLTVSTFAMGGPDSEGHKEYSKFLDSVFTHLKQKNIPNLIVDIRGNGGGHDPNDILLYSYLTSRNFRENKTAFTIFQKIPYTTYYIDDDIEELPNELKEEHSIFRNGKYYQNDSFNEIWKPNKIAFNGNLVLLIDPYVASAGSLFASLVKSDETPVVIGEETLGGYYGHTGHIPVNYQLPNSNLLLSFSIVDLEQDVNVLDDENYGDGIMPDYKITQTYQDFLNHKDTQLNYAINFVKKKKLK